MPSVVAAGSVAVCVVCAGRSCALVSVGFVSWGAQAGSMLSSTSSAMVSDKIRFIRSTHLSSKIILFIMTQFNLDCNKKGTHPGAFLHLKLWGMLRHARP